VTYPDQEFGVAKLFDFRRITLFCLEKRFLKHKMTIRSKNFWGDMVPVAPPGYSYGRKCIKRFGSKVANIVFISGINSKF